MGIKDLLIYHDYYCSDNNYYSNEASMKYDTWEDFYVGFKDADIDMNLVFRWDLKRHLDEDENAKGSIYMEIFMLHQRKGIFRPILIREVEEKDVTEIVEYLTSHKEKLDSIWKPL